MLNKPTFTIVTCTWNSAATLGDTLASVAAQTWQDVEHIFVDGGSTDATLDLIDAYPGNKRLLRDVQGGISHAMNEGIRHASGDYIAHLHSDDYYFCSDVLATVAERFAVDKVDWLFGNIRVLKEGVLHRPHPMHPFSYRALAAGKAFVPHPAVFVRKAAFDRVGLFDERLTYAMDIDLWLRLGALARPSMVGRTFTVFRDHAGSLSSANRIKARQEEFSVRRRHLGKAPLAFGVYCLRYLKRMRQLRQEA
ncbi:glycosyltransferase family 2 protein [Massilia soli]|uniref:Glycosyltransferase n=2 Tax=Pseudomonadota TaxID=1224 RepID=A0ABS7SKV5_9BURK|nr:glycosyltransferase family 2 protein [Massilia soli]MBZ2206827.1 glycosyltransferase [Massilia soli]